MSRREEKRREEKRREEKRREKKGWCYKEREEEVDGKTEVLNLDSSCETVCIGLTVSWARCQVLGSAITPGTSGNMASLLQGEKQLFDKFWRGTFKAVATPRPESVIIASITARREANRMAVETGNGARGFAPNLFSQIPLPKAKPRAEWLETSVCMPAKPIESKSEREEQEVKETEKKRHRKHRGRKRHSRRRCQSVSLDADFSPRPAAKTKKKKKKSVRKRRRERAPVEIGLLLVEEVEEGGECRQREKRKGKSVGLRIGTLNVGTMTGKGRELADMMERRKVDILCVQETRWKGSKACSIGAGFKLFYYGVDSKRNGVGVVLKEEFVRNVLEVKRVSDRVMSLKLEIEGVMLNVVSGYAPQVGCELEEKERFWSELDEVMESIPTGERVVIGADFNGHVGEGNTGDEEVMGKFGVKERNLEGQMVVDFAKRMDMGVVNTYFQKREEHRVTYKSGGRRTQVDYILCRRGNLKEISDCKVVVGESVARQHRMVVCRMTLMVCKTKRSKIEMEKKTKWWKLKKEECCEEFREKLRQALGGQVVLPDDWETTAEVIRETGRKVLGVSSGRRKEDKETWWWNEEVQDSIQRKRLAKKKWDMDRTEENRQEYKELQRRVKREVSKAKQKAYDELYTRLDTREGEKDLYRLARQRDRDGKDVQQVRVIKDRDGRVLTSEESVQRRWKEYFEELMNEENEREKRVEGVNSAEQKVDKIRKDEVRKALKRMKSGKAVGPDDIPVEVWKCLGEAAVEFLASLFNRVLESEKMPEEWRRSVLVPIEVDEPYNEAMGKSSGS
ncbi:hypothetical protein QTP70_009438 [Hemibagrus guttatus]|uniref:Endonuclease/exonuclease/phosphatase domain-containing protein n=1 Tax=Hemibagrus guttatus TaxID=175788 RepID=A0AAE0Q5H8_9TELE|nr:hypothetical protein QTP70_009438 [Hemibagrus guttatus]